MAAMDDAELQRLYAWVDEIPLSRPKRNIARDFADGVLVAEVCHHYFPRLVDLHNYPPANSMQQKLYNWDTLNSRARLPRRARRDRAVGRSDGRATARRASTPPPATQVLRKLGATLPRHEIEAVCQCAPGAIERCLNGLQLKMARYRAAQQQKRANPPAPRREAAPADGEDPAEERSAPRPASRAPNVRGRDALQHEVDQELLIEKEQEIHDLRETVDILEQKIAKLEQLVRLKDTKITKLKESMSHR